MKSSDIIWGGDHKVIVTLRNQIEGMKEGDEVQIEYNYLDNVYELTFEGKKTAIVPKNQSSEDHLDLIRNGKSSMNTILSMDEDGCFLQLRIFEEIVSLGQLSTLRIAITDDVIDKLTDKEQQNPLEALKEKFIYTDPKTKKTMIFVKGYNKKNADFSILSRRNRLNVSRDSDSYISSNYARYDSSYADFDAVYLISGNIEFVDSTRDAKISDELNKNMEKIRSSGKYFEIWEAYLNLERISMLQHAKDTGVVKYKSVRSQATSDGYKYIFTLEDGQYAEFSKDDILDSYAEDIINSEKTTPDNITSYRTTKVGAFSRVIGNECVVIDTDAPSINNHIPAEGYLFTSLSGDKIRMQRCEIAKERISNNRAEIDHLQEIIEDGTLFHNQIGENNPITNKLKASPQFKNKTFNDEQIQAIDNAINTPDISLILGPPGTGKTTVIKGIVTRFEELFKKNNPNETPDILISSFQHEAVDNAAIGMENDGLPANRTGGKKREGSNVSFYIDDWKKKKTKELSEQLDKNQVEKDDSIESLRGQIFAWSKKGCDLTEGFSILKNQINENMVSLSDDVLNESRTLIAQVENGGKTEAIKSILNEEDQQRNIILLSQRLDNEAFKDDGVRHAKKLKIAIEDEGLFDDADVEPIKAVISSEGEDAEIFKKYVETVNFLKEHYLKEDVKIQEEKVDIPHQLELLLKRIDGELKNKKIENLNDSMAAETLILRQYLDMIQDDAEIKRIVESYSSINAATCQQSMDIRKGAIDKKYDLVIIDEAARANPLDLMIPMAMGKKVILVGDHKQLPHMLSPEVVKEYRKEGNTEQMQVLEESLFERLFNTLEASGAKKRTTRLTKQYRMNPIISNFASKCFYEEKNTDVGLDSSEVKVEEKQANLGMYKDKPLVFIDLPQETFDAEKSGVSKSRPAEAKVIMDEVVKVLKKDPNKSIGIITFYRKQVDVINEYKINLTDEQKTRVEIGTVDAFQGKEFDVVFLSCVRANNYSEDDLHKKIGHSSDKNRLCVSYTRARQLLVTVGDKETMSFIPEMKELIEICEKGDVGYYELIK